VVELLKAAPARDQRRAPLPVRDMLALILGPGTCVTCLEPAGSELHRQLCEVASA